MTSLNIDGYEYVTTLYMNSDNRNNYEPLNKFNLNYNNKLITIDLIAVYRYQLTNNIYPINSTNNYYEFTYNAVVYSFYVPEGNYTALNLASYIQTQMRAVTGDVNINFTYNSTLSKFQLLAPQTWQMLAAPQQPPPVTNYQANNIGMVFGLRIDNADVANYNSAINPANTLYTFPYPVDLSSTKYIDVSSAYLTQFNPPSGSSSAAANGRTLTRIHTNSQNFGTEEYIRVRNLLFLKWDRNMPLGGQIDVQVYDDQGRLAILNNSRFNFEIVCYRKK